MKKLNLALAAALVAVSGSAFAALAGGPQTTPVVLPSGTQTTPSTVINTLWYTVTGVDTNFITKTVVWQVSPNVAFMYIQDTGGAIATGASLKGSGAVYAASSGGGSPTKCATITTTDGAAAVTAAAAITLGTSAQNYAPVGCN